MSAVPDTAETSAAPVAGGEGIALGAGPTRVHVPALDGLRGLAILGVMEFHLFPGAVPGGVAGALLQLRLIGAAGVDLFFALSGFLITGILFDSVRDRGYFRTFYLRRVLRIFPLYYGVLAVLFLLTPWSGTHWHGMGWVLLAYLQNTDVNGPFYRFAMGNGLSVDHFWSLAVEEQFYLAWPLVIFVVRRRRALLGICLALMVLAPVLRFLMGVHGVDPNYINRSTACRMDALIAGAALALALRGDARERLLRTSKTVFWGAAGMLVLLGAGGLLTAGSAGVAPVWQWGLLSVRYSLLAVGCAALLGWSLRGGSGLARALESKVMRFFGRYSYGLYVLHFVALGLLLRIFKSWIVSVTPNKGVAVLGAGLMALAVAVAVAYLSYNGYEKRFLRLKRYFPYERHAQTPRD